MKKINLVHIVYSFEMGGIETLLLSLLNTLDKNRYEIHLIVLTNDKLKSVSLLNQNIFVYSLDFTPKKLKSFLGLFLAFKKLKKLLQIIKPDITHTHLASFALLFIFVAIKFSKIKSTNIRTVHTAGLFYENQEKISNKIRLFSEKLAMKIVKTNIIGVSNIVHDNNINNFQYIAKEIKLITNGVNLDNFDKKHYINIKKEKFGVHENSYLISYIARLSYEKNHEFLIDLWKSLVKKVPDAVLVIAGDGELDDFLKQKVIESKLEKNIVFLGSINNVAELLAVTDIGVFPSLYEGFGLALIENFAMQIPMVISNIKAFKSIAKNNKDAFLVPLEDKKTFMNIIIRLCQDENLRKRVAKEAYLVAQKFSIKKTIKQHDEYYTKCLTKKGKIR